MTEEVHIVVEMMRSFEKAGGAQTKKKKFGVVARSTRRAKPAFVSALWNGAKVPNGELGLSEPHYGTGVSETIGDYHIHLSSVLSLYYLSIMIRVAYF